MRIFGELIRRRDSAVMTRRRALRRLWFLSADKRLEKVPDAAAVVDPVGDPIFISTRARKDRPVPDPLVLTDPVMPEEPAAPHDLIARHLQADCFHFVSPAMGRRRR